VAAAYERGFARVTTAAIPALLEAVKPRGGADGSV